MIASENLLIENRLSERLFRLQLTSLLKNLKKYHFGNIATL